MSTAEGAAHHNHAEDNEDTAETNKALELSSLTEEEILIAVAGLAPEDRYGNPIRAQFGGESGLFYPTARRLVDRGLLATEREAGSPVGRGRPLRNYYELTPGTDELLADYLEAKVARIQAALRRLRPTSEE